MESEIKPWASNQQFEDCSIKVVSELQMVLNLNFHDFGRLHGHLILTRLSDLLRQKGNSATIFGVGNFGFKFTDYYNPVARDGKIEGHSNDPANDHDLIVVTDADHLTFKNAATSAIKEIRSLYKNGQDDFWYPWSVIQNPKWNTSNFDIPDYCSAKYINMGSEDEVHSLMELHWLKAGSGWHKELFSKYAPWYSTQIGFPIIHISVANDKLRAGIWQPFSKNINTASVHEVRIAIPDKFGEDARDALQAVRIVFGTIQATFAGNKLAVLSKETKKILTNGIDVSSKKLNTVQRKNAESRLLTTLHRTQSLEDAVVREYGGPFAEFPNPFTNEQPVDLVIKTLDEIGWGKAVLGKTVKEFLN